MSTESPVQRPVPIKNNTSQGKRWWKSRTVWVGILQALGGIVAMPFLGLPAGGAIAAKGVIDIALRAVTKDPIEPPI